LILWLESRQGYLLQEYLLQASIQIHYRWINDFWMSVFLSNAMKCLFYAVLILLYGKLWSCNVTELIVANTVSNVIDDITYCYWLVFVLLQYEW
jgi:hypothetical protein